MRVCVFKVSCCLCFYSFDNTRLRVKRFKEENEKEEEEEEKEEEEEEEEECGERETTDKARSQVVVDYRSPAM